MGPRYTSNMKAFKSYGVNSRNQTVKEGCIYGISNLPRFLFHHNEEKEKFFPIRPSEYRLFTGVNPTSEKH